MYGNNLKSCFNCGNSISHDMNFCNKYGVNLKDNPNDDKILCFSCGASVTEDMNFCNKCGVNLKDNPINEDFDTCSNCGAIIYDDMYFCKECGINLKNMPILQNISTKKEDRSNINPFTGKQHFDMVNDDKFLEESFAEYYNIVNQSELADETEMGEAISYISIKLINAVEEHLLKINRLDYTQNYYEWDVHLILNDTVNAFCMPGGKIIVFSGILSIANTEEALAFILAHEMAHALLDHSRTQISNDSAKNVAITELNIALALFTDLGGIERTAINAVTQFGSEYFMMKPFSRTHELEADKLGMLIAKWAGYDISEIPTFWQRMSEFNSNENDFFSTHPSDSKRIEAMNRLVFEISNQKDFHNSPVL